MKKANITEVYPEPERLALKRQGGWENPVRFMVPEWDRLHLSIKEHEDWMDSTVLKYVPADGNVYDVAWCRPIIGPTQVWVDGRLVTGGLDYVRDERSRRVQK